MPSYLSLLPDEIFHIVYRNILDECIRQTALRCRVKWLHKRKVPPTTDCRSQ